jgi:hypothetical protein
VKVNKFSSTGCEGYVGGDVFRVRPEMKNPHMMVIGPRFPARRRQRYSLKKGSEDTSFTLKGTSIIDHETDR